MLCSFLFIFVRFEMEFEIAQPVYLAGFSICYGKLRCLHKMLWKMTWSGLYYVAKLPITWLNILYTEWFSSFNLVFVKRKQCRFQLLYRIYRFNIVKREINSHFQNLLSNIKDYYRSKEFHNVQTHLSHSFAWCKEVYASLMFTSSKRNWNGNCFAHLNAIFRIILNWVQISRVSIVCTRFAFQFQSQFNYRHLRRIKSSTNRKEKDKGRERWRLKRG